MLNFKEPHFQFIPLSFWNIIILHEFLSVHILGFKYPLIFINWENVFLRYAMLKKFSFSDCSWVPHILYAFYYILTASVSAILQTYFTDENMKLEECETIFLWKHMKMKTLSSQNLNNILWNTTFDSGLGTLRRMIDWFQNNTRKDKSECCSKRLCSHCLETYILACGTGCLLWLFPPLCRETIWQGLPN